MYSKRKSKLIFCLHKSRVSPAQKALQAACLYVGHAPSQCWICLMFNSGVTTLQSPLAHYWYYRTCSMSHNLGFCPPPTEQRVAIFIFFSYLDRCRIPYTPPPPPPHPPLFISWVHMLPPPKKHISNCKKFPIIFFHVQLHNFCVFVEFRKNMLFLMLYVTRQKKSCEKPYYFVALKKYLIYIATRQVDFS
jgi:hypothetical protein